MPLPCLLSEGRRHITSPSSFVLHRDGGWSQTGDRRGPVTAPPGRGVCRGGGWWVLKEVGSSRCPTPHTAKGVEVQGWQKRTAAEPRAGADAGRDPGSATRQVLGRPPRRVTLRASSLRSPGHATLGRSSLRSFPAGIRHAQPSRAALTPEEALAPSSSSPLQAGDVGLTARSQKAAPSGARSPRTAAGDSSPGPRPQMQL